MQIYGEFFFSVACVRLTLDNCFQVAKRLAAFVWQVFGLGEEGSWV